MILGRYAHSGIRVRPKTTTNDKFEKMSLSLKNDTPDSKADFSESFILYLKLNVESVAYTIAYLTHNYLIYKKQYSK